MPRMVVNRQYQYPICSFFILIAQAEVVYSKLFESNKGVEPGPFSGASYECPRARDQAEVLCRGGLSASPQNI